MQMATLEPSSRNHFTRPSSPHVHVSPPMKDMSQEIRSSASGVDVDVSHTSLLTTPTSSADRALRRQNRIRELGGLLARLPPELILMVLKQLLNSTGCTPNPNSNRRRKFKSIISRTSLVCREWCRSQRPMLFADLDLRSIADLRFLLDTLRHPTNAHLSAAVAVLHIRSDGAVPISVYRCCRLLASQLPSLRQLYMRAGQGSDVFRPSLQPFLARLKQLALYGAKLFSLSALVHVLGNASELEILQLDYCHFVHSENRPPTRMHRESFPKLRQVWYSAEARDNRAWGLGWLSAPLLARRCEGHPEDAASGNSDAELLVHLGTFLDNTKSSRMQTVMRYEKDTDTVQIIHFSEMQSRIQVRLWPSTSPSSNVKWSVIRTIECYTLGDMKLDGIDWELVDQSVADKAVRLEKFTIYSNEDSNRRTLASRLPKLRAMERLSIEDHKARPASW